jgi:hypothetical protein
MPILTWKFEIIFLCNKSTTQEKYLYAHTMYVQQNVHKFHANPWSRSFLPY